jgi:hypothetical protein
VLCSPSTLFAVLAVLRQAVDAFALERTSDEILQLLAGFADQWGRFTDQLDKVGRGLETTQRAYDALASTRRTQLERQLGGSRSCVRSGVWPQWSPTTSGPASCRSGAVTVAAAAGGGRIRPRFGAEPGSRSGGAARRG